MRCVKKIRMKGELREPCGIIVVRGGTTVPSTSHSIQPHT